MSSNTITPFTVSIPQQSLDDLSKRLSTAIISQDQPPEETKREEETWNRGVPSTDINRLVAYWKNDFDWKSIQRNMNKSLRMFQTVIPVDGFEDLDIHFVHHKSTDDVKASNSIPLLFIHGCKFLIWSACDLSGS